MTSRYKTTVTTDAVCAQCGDGIDATLYVRSNTWAYGTVGVRMALCSTTCRDTWDATNKTQQEGTDNGK